MTASNLSGPPSQRGERLRLARGLAAALALLVLVCWLVFLLRARPRELRPGLDLTRGIVADEVHRYQVDLAAGEFLRVTATQGGSRDGLDLVLVLRDAQGAEIARADDAMGGLWDEELAWAPKAAGTYQVEVQRAGGPKAAYRIQVKALGRPAQAEDALRAEALRLDQEATLLLAQERDYPRQIELRRQAHAIWRQLGDRRREAEARSLIGSAWFILGDYGKAVEHYHQAARIWSELANREEQARALLELARAQRRRERPEAARQAFDRGLALATEPEARMFLLHGRGNLLLDLGSLDPGTRDLRASLDLAQRLGNSWVAANAFHDLGFAYRSLGRWDDAILHFNKAAQTSDKPEMQMTANNSLGGVYANLGDWDQAIEHYEKALELTRQLDDLRNQAKILNNLALVHHRSRQLQRAWELFEQVLELKQLDPDTKATVLNNMAFIRIEQGKPHKALGLCDRAWELHTEGDQQTEAAILEAQGIAYLRLKEYGTARQTLGRALALNEERNDQFRQASVTLVQGKVARAEGDLDTAVRYASRAVTIVESFRTGVEDDTLRASFLASKRDPYDFYVDTLVELHQARPAGGFDAESLRINEMSRARSLLDLLNRAVPPAGRKAAPAPSPPPAQARPLTLGQIQAQVLGEDTLLLEYALGEERSYLWAVTPKSLHVFPLLSKQAIEETAREFYDQLRVRTREGVTEAAVERADARATELAAELSGIILEPVAKAGLLRKESTVLVVSDGALQYIPFSALPLPSSPAAGPRGAPVLMVEEHEIVHLPSASVLASLREELDNRQPPARTLALFADPVFALDDSRVRPPGFLDKLLKPRQPARRRGDVDEEYHRLLWSEVEAEAILDLVDDPSQVLKRQGFDASVPAVTGAPLDQYRYLHFATHGRIDSSQPERSGLVLSLYDRKGERQKDGSLRLADVYNLRLNADLVVLSACETALGPEIRGEGLIGLTRGFMYAGSRRVLASLWSVDDRVTSELMKRLYQGILEEGRSPAAALRQAQRDMLRDEDWKSPYYWAGFSLQGEWR